MSFRYGQFGTGFLRTLPQPSALSFREWVETRGEDVTIVRLTKTGEDDYGRPQYSESSHTEKAFVESRGRERIIMPGTVKLGSVRLFMVPWAAIGEEGYEVEVDGVRYHITSLDERKAYLMVEAERKA